MTVLLFSKLLDTMVNVTDCAYAKTNFWCNHCHINFYCNIFEFLGHYEGRWRLWGCQRRPIVRGQKYRSPRIARSKFWSYGAIKKKWIYYFPCNGISLPYSPLRRSFFQGISTIKTVIYDTAKILQRIQFCHPQGHPRSPWKSSPYTFFSARVAGGNFHIFLFTKCGGSTR